MLKTDLCLDHDVNQDINIISELIASLRKEGVSTKIRELKKELDTSNSEASKEELREKILDFAIYNEKLLEVLNNSLKKITVNQTYKIIKNAEKEISDFKKEYYNNMNDLLKVNDRLKLYNVLSRYVNALNKVLNELEGVKCFLFEYQNIVKSFIPNETSYLITFSSGNKDELSINEKSDILNFVKSVLKIIDPTYTDTYNFDLCTGSPRFEFSLINIVFPELSKTAIEMFEIIKKPSFDKFLKQYKKYCNEKNIAIKKNLVVLEKWFNEGKISENDFKDQRKKLQKTLLDSDGINEEKLKASFIKLSSAYKNIEKKDIKFSTRELNI